MVDPGDNPRCVYCKIQTVPMIFPTISNSGGVLNSTTGEEMDVMNLIKQLIILYIQEL